MKKKKWNCFSKIALIMPLLASCQSAPNISRNDTLAQFSEQIKELGYLRGTDARAFDEVNYSLMAHTSHGCYIALGGSLLENHKGLEGYVRIMATPKLDDFEYLVSLKVSKTPVAYDGKDPLYVTEYKKGTYHVKDGESIIITERFKPCAVCGHD